MDWYTLEKEFKKKFPKWTVAVEPRCISNSRYTYYYYEALAYVLGKKSDIEEFITLDESNKRIVVHR